MMVKSLIMAKYVWDQKYMRAGMKNRKSPNRGLSGIIIVCHRGGSRVVHREQVHPLQYLS